MLHMAEGLINSINLSKNSTWHISFIGFLGFMEEKVNIILLQYRLVQPGT